jgi:lycopene cyclase domain-containing protein
MWLSVLTIIMTGIFNSYLTSRPVVEYNREVMSNIRVGTIPIEDFGYGLGLVWLTAWVYEKKR